MKVCGCLTCCQTTFNFIPFDFLPFKFSLFEIFSYYSPVFIQEVRLYESLWMSDKFELSPAALGSVGPVGLLNLDRPRPKSFRPKTQLDSTVKSEKLIQPPPPEKRKTSRNFSLEVWENYLTFCCITFTTMNLRKLKESLPVKI